LAAVRQKIHLSPCPNLRGRLYVTYEELASRLEKHGFKETKASIANKLARATVPAAFFLATLAALELEGVRLEDL
jgi:Domain of unknown function (DUF6471)